MSLDPQPFEPDTFTPSTPAGTTSGPPTVDVDCHGTRSCGRGTTYRHHLRLLPTSTAAVLVAPCPNCSAVLLYGPLGPDAADVLAATGTEILDATLAARAHELHGVPDSYRELLTTRGLTTTVDGPGIDQALADLLSD